jgi:hypothetical protein
MATNEDGKMLEEAATPRAKSSATKTLFCCLNMPIADCANYKIEIKFADLTLFI